MRSRLAWVAIWFAMGCGGGGEGPATDAASQPDGTTGSGADAALVDAPSGGSDAAATPDAEGPSVDADPGAPDAACDPVAEDRPARGMDCTDVSQCPEGYICQDHHGIVLQQTCEIPCTLDCECPSPLTCKAFTDKAGTHYNCAK